MNTAPTPQNICLMIINKTHYENLKHVIKGIKQLAFCSYVSKLGGGQRLCIQWGCRGVGSKIWETCQRNTWTLPKYLILTNTWSMRFCRTPILRARTRSWLYFCLVTITTTRLISIESQPKKVVVVVVFNKRKLLVFVVVVVTVGPNLNLKFRQDLVFSVKLQL